MHYVSTRGGGTSEDFEHVLLSGLAADGGLFVPVELPRFAAAELRQMQNLPYSELAFRIASAFTGETFSNAALRSLIEASHADFSPAEIAPLTRLGESEYLLELFHGPTLAFKDFALQVLGRMLDQVLAKRGQRVLVLGATSGDTGSAALEACRHSRQIDICILPTHGKVSALQRKQMTTFAGANVRNLAVRGNFDDCQRLVKDALADQSFLPLGQSLAAVNSINWARIVMQIVYYFHASFRVSKALGAAAPRPVSFSVPTGNFGDVYAGYLARSMGLPVERLIVATNSNDILHRFISGNDYASAPLRHTLSPSMDILIPSNFERYLFELLDRDSEALGEFMAAAAGSGAQLPDSRWHTMKEIFASARVDDQRTCATISEVWREHRVLLDPHSAVGVCAARDRRSDSRHDPETPMICLATAHPAKFPDAVESAIGARPPLPAHMANLYSRPERVTEVPDDLVALERLIRRRIAR